jgi:hypothetical protein
MKESIRRRTNRRLPEVIAWMIHKIAVYAVVLFVGLFVGVLGSSIKPSVRRAMVPLSRPQALTSTHSDPRRASARELATAGRLREAQDIYLRILILAPGDRDALRDLITVRRVMAGQNAAKLQQQGEAYQRALANGTETEEHYTPAALQILTMANFAAADQIRGARVIRANATAPAAAPISSSVQRVVRRGGRKATAARPRPPDPVVSPAASAGAPTSATPERPAPAPPPNLASTVPAPPSPQVIVTTSSNPAGPVSREPDQDPILHPAGPPAATTPAGSRQAGSQPANLPAAAPPPNPPVTGGTSPGNATKTSGGSSASGGGRLPLVPLFPNPKPRGDQ